MKLIKLLAASGLALTLAGTASATTVLRIAGAATYRPPTQKAIEDILKPGYVFGYNGSSRYKPNAAIYSGTLASNSQPIIIETYWTGDLAGVVDAQFASGRASASHQLAQHGGLPHSQTERLQLLIHLRKLRIVDPAQYQVLRWSGPKRFFTVGLHHGGECAQCV